MDIQSTLFARFMPGIGTRAQSRFSMCNATSGINHSRPHCYTSTTSSFEAREGAGGASASPCPLRLPALLRPRGGSLSPYCTKPLVLFCTIARKRAITARPKYLGHRLNKITVLYNTAWRCPCRTRPLPPPSPSLRSGVPACTSGRTSRARRLGGAKKNSYISQFRNKTRQTLICRMAHRCTQGRGSDVKASGRDKHPSGVLYAHRARLEP